MSNRAQIAALPFRLKVATLLQCESYQNRIPREDTIDYIDSIPREINESTFEEFGISLHSMDASESSDDEASSFEVLVFRSGEEYLVARVCYPAYADDNYDGRISYMTDVMDFQRARLEVANEFERLKSAIRERIKLVESNESAFLNRLDLFSVEPPIEAEPEEA